MRAVAFRASGIEKRFGATVALNGVTFELHAGEVRALVGENGAGKSTLMRVIAGAIAPDAGEMQIAGEPFKPRSPAEACARGVAMIHQELSIAPDLTVVENVMLGREKSRAGFARRGEERAIASAALARLGHGEMDLNARCGDLSLALRQVVEIARALAASARVFVLDEPTSSLSRADAAQLFTVVRELASQGCAVAYVSHFLEEVSALSDAWTCLRDGRVVAEGDTRTTSIDAIVEHMAGREICERYPQVPHEIGDVVLEIRGLCGPSSVREVDLFLRRGEVFGLFGLVGAGRSELLRTIFGLAPSTGGAASVRGGANVASSPRESLRAGLAFASEDRRRDGLLLPMSIEDNVTMSRLAPYSMGGALQLKKRWSAALRWIERVHCRCVSPAQLVETLSGGNQQKIALARLLHHEANILLIDEPTRGIDVATKSEIYRMIGELAAAGRTIVMSSSYLPELLNVCDRVGVMYRGRLVEVRAASEWNATDVLRFATGAEARRT